MRILLLTDVYFPRINGVSTSIQTFAHEFINKGHEVTLIAPDYGQHHDEPFEVIRIPSRYLPVDPEDRILKRGKVRELTPRLDARRFDILHVHTPFIAHYAGLNLSRELGIPVIESYHTFFEEYLDKYIPIIPRSWLKFAARRFSSSQCNSVDGLVVPSQAMLEVLRGYGVTKDASVIPTGIKPDQFAQGNGHAFRTRYGIPEDRPVLVHVGRIAHEKNIGFLIDVLAAVSREIPDVLLVIAGDGPAKEAIRRDLHNRGLQDHVLFVGYLKRDGELQDCFSAGNAFIFASRTETQGLVLLEAMALGTPVVSTAVMGTGEVLSDGDGAIVSEEDVARFADHTVKLLRDSGLQQALSRRGRDYARRWSASALADRMLGYYEQVIQQQVSAVQPVPSER